MNTWPHYKQLLELFKRYSILHSNQRHILLWVMHLRCCKQCIISDMVQWHGFPGLTADYPKEHASKACWAAWEILATRPSIKTWLLGNHRNAAAFSQRGITSRCCLMTLISCVVIWKTCPNRMSKGNTKPFFKNRSAMKEKKNANHQEDSCPSLGAVITNRRHIDVYNMSKGIYLAWHSPNHFSHIPCTVLRSLWSTYFLRLIC